MCDGMRSPVVRTNPVTGWKSLFGAGHQVEAGWINDVTERESDILKTYCESLLSWSNHEGAELTAVLMARSPPTHHRQPRSAGTLPMEQERCCHLGQVSIFWPTKGGGGTD